ncbi:hypothetical protein J7L60_02100, partial [Candidatus Bathyarchaeota archaeon]|nr:hypothetical protein [Candidatus Bathyarchaeota archaeon]
MKSLRALLASLLVLLILTSSFVGVPALSSSSTEGSHGPEDQEPVGEGISDSPEGGLSSSVPLGEGGEDLDVGGDEGLAPGSGVSVEGPMEAESPLGDLIKIFSEGEVVLVRDYENQFVVFDEWNSHPYDGWEWTAPNSTEDSDDWIDIEVADMDGDGVDEIIGLREGRTLHGESGYQLVAIFKPRENQDWFDFPSGEPRRTWYWHGLEGHLKRLAVGDFDGDLGNDILVLQRKLSGQTSNWVFLDLRSWNGTRIELDFLILSDVDPSLTPNYDDVAACDIEGDGRDEILLFNKEDKSLTFLRYTGEHQAEVVKTFTLPSYIQYGSTGPYYEVKSWKGAVACGDLDGDKSDEVVLLGKDEDSDPFVYFYDPQGGDKFFNGWAILLLLEKMGDCFTVGDVDADGLSEVVVVRRGEIDFIDTKKTSSGQFSWDHKLYDISDYGRTDKGWRAVAIGDLDGEDSVYAQYTGKMAKVTQSNVIAIINEPPYERGVNEGSAYFTSSRERATGVTHSCSVGAYLTIGFGAKFKTEIFGVGVEGKVGIETSFSYAVTTSHTTARATSVTQSFSTSGESIVVASNTYYDVYLYQIIGPRSTWMGGGRYEDSEDSIISVNIPRKVELQGKPLSEAREEWPWFNEQYGYQRPQGPAGPIVNGRVYTYPRQRPDLPSNAYVLYDGGNDPMEVRWGVEEGMEFGWSISEENSITETWEVSLGAHFEVESEGYYFSLDAGITLGWETTHSVSITTSNAVGCAVSAIPQELGDAYRYWYVPYLYYVADHRGISPYASGGEWDLFYLVLDYYVLDNPEHDYPLGDAYKYGLEVTPLNGETHNVNPGHTTRYLLRVTNLGGEENDIDLSIASMPSGWTVTLSNTTVHLEPGSTADISVDVTPPFDAPGLTTHDITLSAVSEHSSLCNKTLVLSTFVNQVADVDLSIEDTSHTIHPGETTIYYVSVTNYGNSEDTISITSSRPPPEWIVFLNATEVALGINEEAVIEINVTAASAGNGDVLTTLLTAVSEGQPYVSDSVVLETVATVNYGVELSCDRRIAFTGAGETVLFTITVRNTGEDSDSYDFFLYDVPSYWTVTLNQYSANLAVDETATLRLTAQVHVDTPMRAFRILLVAVSRSDPSAYASLPLLVVVTDSDMVVEGYEELPNATTLALGDVAFGSSSYPSTTISESVTTTRRGR